VVPSLSAQAAQKKKAGTEFDEALAANDGDLAKIAAVGFWCRPGVDFSVATGSDEENSEDEAPPALPKKAP
jgi:hypothetical protein